MADGVGITEGTGKTVGCDELTDATIGGLRQIQYVKLMDGTVDSANKAIVDSSGRLATLASQTGTWTVQPGNTPNTTPWLSKLSDGTNSVAVRAGSSAAAAGDASLVVQLSPIGEVADGATDSGNGNKISAKAYAGLSSSTLLSAGQRADLAADVDRVIIVRPHCALEDITSGVISSALTTTTSTSCVASAGTGIKNYVTAITASNTSATATDLLIQDGSGGTTKWILPVPATGGVTQEFPTPLGGFSAATAIFVACVTSGASVKVSINGFKSKV